MIIEREIVEAAGRHNQRHWQYEPVFANVPCSSGRRYSVAFNHLTVGDLTQLIEDRVRRAVKLLERWRKSGSPRVRRAAVRAVAQANSLSLLQQYCFGEGVGGPGVDIYAFVGQGETEVDTA